MCFSGGCIISNFSDLCNNFLWLRDRLEITVLELLELTEHYGRPSDEGLQVIFGIVEGIACCFQVRHEICQRLCRRRCCRRTCSLCGGCLFLEISL